MATLSGPALELLVARLAQFEARVDGLLEARGVDPRRIGRAALAREPEAPADPETTTQPVAH